MDIIETADLGYVFPDEAHPALSGVSLTVSRGEVLGLVGPDGAGKTTLIRLLAGLFKPSSGTVRILGRDPVQDHALLSSKIGYMPQKFGLYEDLTIRENLALYADLHNVQPDNAAAQTRELLRTAGLEAFTERPAGKLSGGMKQKLGLACAMLGNPEILLLDEPGVGVDPLSRRELWALARRMRAQGIAIVWATSYLDEAAQCDRVCMVHEGRIRYFGKPGDLLGKLEGRTVSLTPPEQSRIATLRRLQAREDVLDGVIEGSRIRLLLRTPFTPGGWTEEFPDIGLVRPTFEEAFIDLLGGVKNHPATPAMDSRFAGRAPDKPVVIAENLTKTFGDFVADDHLNFHVMPGEIFGLIGPNGAGKTTAFRMMCGLLRPTSGRAEILGIDLRKDARRARQQIGYMAQKFSLYGTLSVRQNLVFFSGIYGLSGARQQEKIEEAVHAFALEEYINHDAGTLPLGIKQRLSLACAVMHGPAFLFLDEPTSGVDPIARREFWERINAMSEQGITIIVTTHFMDEAQYMHRMCIIDRGKIIAMGSPEDLKASAATERHPDPTMEQAFISLIEKGGGA